MMSIFAKAVILIFLAFSATTLYGQTTDSLIRQIRLSCQKINQDHTLKVLTLDNEEFIPEPLDAGASLTGFYKGNDIYKMKVWFGLSYCIRQYEYYYNNRQLIFIYETERDFPQTKDGGLDYSKLIPAFEGRYYLADAHIIAIKTKGTKRMDKMPDAQFIKSLIQDAPLYTKQLKARLKKINHPTKTPG